MHASFSDKFLSQRRVCDITTRQETQECYTKKKQITQLQRIGQAQGLTVTFARILGSLPSWTFTTPCVSSHEESGATLQHARAEVGSGTQIAALGGVRTSTRWAQKKEHHYPQWSSNHLLHPTNFRDEREFALATAHDRLNIRPSATHSLPQSTAHPSHQTPSDRRKGVELGCECFVCKAFQRQMQSTMGKTKIQFPPHTFVAETSIPELLSRRTLPRSLRLSMRPSDLSVPFQPTHRLLCCAHERCAQPNGAPSFED